MPTGVGPGATVAGGVRFSRPPSPNPARGASARSGLYLARLTAGDIAIAKLFTLLR